MTKDILYAVLEKLARISRQSKTRMIIMGGLAVSVFARPRATYDIDGIISLAGKDLRKFLGLLKVNGFKFGPSPVKYVAGLPFITFYYPPYKTYVDLFLASTEFQYEVLHRARMVRLGKLSLRLISPEDLILVKLQSGREKDLEDVKEIILTNKSKLDFTYLRKWAGLLGVDVFLSDELKSLR